MLLIMRHSNWPLWQLEIRYFYQNNWKFSIPQQLISQMEQNNTITDGGSTAPLYCWYHTEEKTIQEHKIDWKDVRGIVGRR